MASQAASKAMALCRVVRSSPTGRGAPSIRPHRTISRTMRRALSSIWAGLTCPARTAASSTTADQAWLEPDFVAAGQALPGVRQLVPVDDAELVEGELAVDLLSDGDLRAVTSRWVTAQGLTLLEQRRERSNLEEVFRRLTGADDAPARA
jgi:hypothetical protein